jgi:hypothetical protein
MLQKIKRYKPWMKSFNTLFSRVRYAASSLTESYEIAIGFLLYSFVVLVFSLFMIYYVAPRHGTRIPLVYISICSLVGSMSVMAIKGFGVALKLTFAGNNQLTHPSTYVFGIVVVVCILVQMNYFNKALAIFSTNVYVG